MGHNSWKSKVERIERMQRYSADRTLVADALEVVEKWNADLRTAREDAHYGYSDLKLLPQFCPTIGCAIRAGRPYLRLLCPACKQHGDVDLRRVVRPANFPIMGIYDALVCTVGCGGRRDAPRPDVIGLFEGPDDPLADLRPDLKA